MSPASKPAAGFDYIIVGAGSAGCVLANRLSAQPSARVLLLEAGSWDRSPFIQVPGLLYEAISDRNLNWRFWGEPDETLNGRKLDWAAGRGIGGSSSINGMVFARGLPADFDTWSAMGNPGWDWASVLPYFKRLETWHGDPNEARGQDGPVHVRAFAEPNPACLSVLNAFVSMGVPYSADYNAGITHGIGLTQANQNAGRRHSAAHAYLHPIRKRSNLTIRTGTRVIRVALEGTRCAGVVVVEEAGREVLIPCDGEVVLAAGAIGSPKILMASGIGAPAELAPHGVAVKHGLPGVGANMNEHVSAVVSNVVAVKTYDATRKGVRRAAAGLRWLVDREGPATSPAMHLQGYIKTAPGLPTADVQVQTLAVGVELGAANKQGVTTAISLCQPEVRGRVSLRSADPADPPRIAIKLLDSDKDIGALTRAARFVREVYRSGPGHQFAARESGPMADIRTDADWLAYFRATSRLNWHPTSTCRMGPTEEDVVDPTLRVHGLDGLRIADASIMPVVTSGNTNAVCMMIAERAADLILSASSGSDVRRPRPATL